MNEFEFLNLDQITNGIFVHILIFKKTIQLFQIFS